MYQGALDPHHFPLEGKGSLGTEELKERGGSNFTPFFRRGR